MTRTFLYTSLSAAILLTACYRQSAEPQVDQETPPAEISEAAPPEPETAPPTATLPERPSSTAGRADIDWAAAQSDFANRDQDIGEEVTIASTSGELAVPILLPSGPIAPASVTGDKRPKVVPVADGYYASYPGDAYDMEIHGTDRLISAPGRGLTPGDSDLRFEETLVGAQVSFSRYGASYIVEFSCNFAPPNQSCVSEEEAIAAVNELLIARAR